jgi:hypothetical protein
MPSVDLSRFDRKNIGADLQIAKQLVADCMPCRNFAYVRVHLKTSREAGSRTASLLLAAAFRRTLANFVLRGSEIVQKESPIPP